MTKSGSCASCGLKLDIFGPHGLCPTCLLKMGLAKAETRPDSLSPDAATMATAQFSGVASPSAVSGGATTGGVIGPYRLLSVLGEGGMGVVFLAEQEEPIRRRVAVKVIKVGMDTREVVARFEAERQALALMDHPNIASVLDAGSTPDGRPYFAMEYVPGVPLTDYCDAHRLSTRDRLELFIRVCEAIQHAHQKGVIHRDLKPSNVLVTEVDGRPVPKVIDFGIAKATDQRLTEETVFTRHGQLIGTPEYMSPEQADIGATDLDTRTDIYSLGVMLYELLAGGLPFSPTQLRERGYVELLRIIREEEPMRPSTRLTTVGITANEVAERRRTKVPTLAQELRGDLDWITLKALEKDRAQRYATVSELAADLARYLRSEPVIARPPSVRYRVRKFVRRNRLAVTAASLVLVAILAGLAVSSVLYVREGRARREAVAQRERADQALSSAEMNLYYNNVDLADREVELNNIGHVDELLQTCPVSLRSWEWYYLLGISHMETAKVDVPGGIASIAFSADGSRCFAATGAMTIDVFDTKSARLLRKIQVDASNGRVDRFLVSTDAASIVGVNVSAGALQRVEVWDGETGRRRFSMAGRYRVALSADGRRLATAMGLAADSPGAGAHYKLQLWDAHTGIELAALGEMPAASMDLVLNRDGTRLAVVSLPDTSGKQDIRLIDASSGRAMIALADAPSQTAAAREWLRVPAAFSMDGTLFLAAGEGSDGPRVKVWRTVDGREVSTIRVKPTIHAAGFTADANSLVLALEDHVLHVVDRTTGEERQRMAGHSDAITDLAFASDGTFLASAGFDNTVRLWNPRGGPPPALAVQAGSGGTLAGAYVSPDRRAMATFMTPPDVVADGRPRNPAVVTLDGWDLATGRRLFTLPPPVAGLSLPFGVPVIFSPDGSRVALPTAVCEDIGNSRVRATYRIRVLDASSGKLLATLEQDPSGGIETTEQAARQRSHMLLNADMDIGAAGDRVAVKVRRTAGPPPAVGNPLASSVVDIDIWDVATGRRLTTITVRGAFVTKVVLSPDRVHAAVVVLGPSSAQVNAPSGAILLYDLATGRMVRALEHSGGVEAMTDGGFGAPVFSRDGKSAAVPLHQAIGIWDVTTGRQRCSLPGTTLNLLSFAFSPDGTRLVSVTTDGTKKLWNALTGGQIMSLRESVGLCSVREVVLEGPSASDIQSHVSIGFSDDGRQIVQTTIAKDPKGLRVRITSWDGSPRH